ncbi:MAG: 16S rRNA (adenine(1518)-N(6)/adenine(1519)-N(6))-dimethyltransferase RsmA [Sphaerochaetaceae bacterium]|nr:16S rRNA (adenine(1518)-N(6)/adenine(1519)-N(6))-dimethyltransferase RsmA [Sphaerochaetaceae bacterium]
MSWNFIYDSPKEITKLLDKEGLAMSKKFGQNFLISSHIREKLFSLVKVESSDKVWEIGPGLGALTILLINSGALVKAFEIDYGFCRILEEQAFKDDKNFSLVKGDALKTLFEQEEIPNVICGNLPYNVGSICIAKLIENSLLPERMVFTIQKEVAERICGNPGDKSWSSLSILCQTEYECSIGLTIIGSSFYPEPNVDSSVIIMERRKNKIVDEDIRPIFLILIRDLFAQRRKTIKNNLQHGKIGKLLTLEKINSCLEESQIPLKERGENLTVKQIVKLAETLKRIQNN